MEKFLGIFGSIQELLLEPNTECYKMSIRYCVATFSYPGTSDVSIIVIVITSKYYMLGPQKHHFNSFNHVRVKCVPTK
jgi:hypothetical protein